MVFTRDEWELLVSLVEYVEGDRNDWSDEEEALLLKLKLVLSIPATIYEVQASAPREKLDEHY